MKFVVSASFGTLAVAAAFALSGEALAPASALVPAAVAPGTHPQRPLWGDTHLHTSNSFDAFTAGLRLGPEEALRFARGEEVRTASGEVAQLHRPLDFLVITDHSDAIGATADLYNTPEEQLSDPVLRRWRTMMHAGADPGLQGLPRDGHCDRPGHPARCLRRPGAPARYHPAGVGQPARLGRALQPAGQIHRAGRVRILAPAQGQYPPPQRHLPRRRRARTPGAANAGTRSQGS